MFPLILWSCHYQIQNELFSYEGLDFPCFWKNSYIGCIQVFERQTCLYRSDLGAGQLSTVSATEVLEIVQLVCNMELLAISSMSEVGSEHKVCFGAFLRLTKVFWAAKKSPKECDLWPPPPPTGPPLVRKRSHFPPFFFWTLPLVLVVEAIQHNVNQSTKLQRSTIGSRERHMNKAGTGIWSTFLNVRFQYYLEKVMLGYCSISVM